MNIKTEKSEVYNYFESLRDNVKDNRIKINKIDCYLDLLSIKGLSLGEPYIKKLTRKIWELRPLKDRILFASVQNNKIILLSVFMKKTQKTPIREIEKAERNLKDYIKRSEEDE